MAYEVVKSLYQRFATFDVLAVNALLAGMANEAAGVVAKAAFDAPTTQTRIAFMRYVGQGHEIAVFLPARDLTDADVAVIRAAYDTEYSRFYDRPVPGSDVEIMSFAVTVATVVLGVDPVANVADAPAPAPIRHHQVLDTSTGERSAWAVYDRTEMVPGCVVQGPCIVAEEETSTLVGAGWTCRMDGLGYLELERVS